MLASIQRNAVEDVPVSSTARPHVIEEEDDDATSSERLDRYDYSETVRSKPPPILRPAPVRVAKPVALKVLRPIPQKAVEAFYDEAYRQGIDGAEVHAATAIAQDWHRKWTQQDEEGHTMPESNQEGPIPDHYAYNFFDRQVGAKNPSPDDLHSEYERKRTRQDYFRHSYSSISDSTAEEDDEESSCSPIPMPEPKRPAHEEVPTVSQGPTQSEGLVRPVALRVVRPSVVIPPDNFFHEEIPLHILQSFRQEHLHRQLSPLTVPSEMSTKRSTDSQSMSSLGLDHLYDPVPTVISHPNSEHSHSLPRLIRGARRNLLHALAAAGGEVGQGAFDDSLNVLSEYFVGLGIDTRPVDAVRPVDGLWLTLTKPSFFGSLGDTDNGDPMYTLGRMTFDMFSPTNLVCSLQGNFNIVKQVPQESRSRLLAAVPPALKEEVEEGTSTLRTYDIVTAFTIEPTLPAYPTAPNKDVRRPIRGIMTTKGYILPDPEVPNRHSVWITGGRIEPNDDPVDQREWKRQFSLNPPKHSMGEKAKLLAVKMLMGATIPTEMNPDGSLEYEFTRPLGGHGVAFVDLLYVDDSLRIVRGHRGTVFVFSKLPDKTGS